MRVLVTGGSGFIGSNLVPVLAARGEVLNLDVAAPRDPEGNPYWKEASVLDKGALSRHFRSFQPTHVIHLGARTDLRGRDVSDYEANITGVANVIEAVAEMGNVEHAIYASSRLVFAIEHRPTSTFDYKPSTPYGASKILGEEHVLRTASLASSWSIVRPTSIWGPWFDTPYRDFFDMVATGRYVKFKGRDPLKSFGYVGNAVHELVEILLADRSKTDERVFWLSDYEPLRLSEWADLVAAELGKRRPVSAPWWAAKLAARAGDLLVDAGVSRVPLTSFRLSNLVTEMVYDTVQTEQVVGALPFDLPTAVRLTVDWYRKYGGRA